MYSVTTALKMVALRSSSMGTWQCPEEKGAVGRSGIVVVIKGFPALAA